MGTNHEPGQIRLNVQWPRERLPRGSGRDASVRASNLWHKYRVTPEQYDAVRKAQGYRCAVCRRHERELPSRSVGRPRKDGAENVESMRLVVDHDHACCPGRKSCGACNRELICLDCNLALGLFADDPGRLHRARDYIYRHRRG